MEYLTLAEPILDRMTRKNDGPGLEAETLELGTPRNIAERRFERSLGGLDLLQKLRAKHLVNPVGGRFACRYSDSAEPVRAASGPMAPCILCAGESCRRLSPARAPHARILSRVKGSVAAGVGADDVGVVRQAVER